MDKKIKELKERFRYANKKEIAAIDQEIDNLVAKDDVTFSKAMIKSAKETVKQVDDLILAEKLKDILPVISVSYFAKTYFNKTPQWFYQRLNGNIVNGSAARFTEPELKKLSSALKDVGNMINNSASCIF
jgi:hypothetical protein